MKIIEVLLENFGKFKDKRILLSEGINLIYGENESGKTTVFMGIKAILFGLVRGRGKAAKNDTFSQYEPWQESNYYAGRLRFSCGDKIFQLERQFDKYGKSAKLFCENDGEELSVIDGDLEMLLDGMGEAEFENTVSIGQMKAETGETLASQMKNFAANYYATGNSELNLSKALEILKKRKKEVDREIRELKRGKQEKRDKLELEASYVWKDLRSVEKERDRIKAELEEHLKKKETWEMEAAEDAAAKEESSFANWRIHPTTLLAMLASVIVAFFILSRPWNYIVMVVIALAEILFLWNRLKDGRKKKNAAKEAERETILAAVEKLEWQLGRLEEEYQEKKVNHMNLREQLAEMDEVEDVFKEQEKRRRALECAEEVILASSKEMQNHLKDRLDQRVSQILCELTGGKYEKVWVDDNLHVSLHSEGRKVEMEQVSRGTIEQIYFALRMAAMEAMHEDEYPVILDDTFAYYDDVRMERTLKWLRANRKQVILFTCHRREEEILRKNGIVFNKVVL